MSWRVLNLPSTLLCRLSGCKLKSNDWVISFSCVSCFVGQLPLPAWMLGQSPWIAPSFFFVFCATKTKIHQQTSKLQGFFLQWITLRDFKDQATRFLKFCWDVIWAQKKQTKTNKAKGWKFRISNEKFIKQNINKNSLNKQMKKKLKKQPLTFYWAHYVWEERKRTDQVCLSSSRHHQHSSSEKKIILSRNRFDTTT